MRRQFFSSCLVSALYFSARLFSGDGPMGPIGHWDPLPTGSNCVPTGSVWFLLVLWGQFKFKRRHQNQNQNRDRDEAGDKTDGWMLAERQHYGATNRVHCKRKSEGRKINCFARYLHCGAYSIGRKRCKRAPRSGSVATAWWWCPCSWRNWCPCGAWSTGAGAWA